MPSAVQNMRHTCMSSKSILQQILIKPGVRINGDILRGGGGSSYYNSISILRSEYFMVNRPGGGVTMESLYYTTPALTDNVLLA